MRCRLVTVPLASSAFAGFRFFFGLPRVDLRFERGESPDAAGSAGIPSHFLDRGIKHPLVGGKLLQGSDPGTRSDDRDKITLLHLFIDELLQRLDGPLG